MAKSSKTRSHGLDRLVSSGLRLFSRHRDDEPLSLPPLLTAMRQLRQHVLDVQGDSVEPFVLRTHAIAAVARESGEHETSAVLLKLATVAELGRYRDVRPDLLELLDQAHAVLNPPNT
jgi:hypothetical protein